MAYVRPTPAELKVRYPEASEIVDTNPTLVAMIIEEAERETDDTWDDDDRRAGVMTLTMHWMSMQGLLAAQSVTTPGGSVVIGGQEVSGRIRSFKVGDVAVDFSDSNKTSTTTSTSSGSTPGDYGRTSYGQRWLELLAKNNPLAAVSGSLSQIMLVRS